MFTYRKEITPFMQKKFNTFEVVIYSFLKKFNHCSLMLHIPLPNLKQRTHWGKDIYQNEAFPHSDFSKYPLNN